MPARIVRPARVDASVLQETDDPLAGPAHARFLLSRAEEQQLQRRLRLHRILEQSLPRRLRLDRLDWRPRPEGAEAAAVGEHPMKHLRVRETDLDALERAHRQTTDR